jgi:GDPmannose 4,6-dehydratase
MSERSDALARAASAPRTALICGISGQDGAYLARELLSRGYKVVGTSRDAQVGSFHNLVRLGIRGQVELASMASNDFRSVLQVLARHEPHEVYHLAGQSSVGLSFEQPVETLESIALSTLNLLEAIRFLGRPIRYYSAGSSECFGDNGDAASNENTPFRPRSPYAVAKAAAFWQVANYREAYGLFACSGILFNHESPLRPERFVTQKIVRTACRIAAGSAETLHLGNLEIHRDWGWAPEYVHAMWLMLQQPTPQDFVIATGVTYPLADFVSETFQCLGLDWRQHVISDPSLMRPTDLRISRADPALAASVLGWRATSHMPDVVPPREPSPIQRATVLRGWMVGLLGWLVCLSAAPSAAEESTRIYKYLRNGAPVFTDVPPARGAYSIYRPSCFACDIYSTVNWNATPLQLDVYSEEINRAAHLYQVDTALVRAVIHAESAFNPRARSPKGAAGLMQLMPGTARDLGVADAHVPSENIRGGVQYLAQLLAQFRNDVRLATAAYNAGPNAVRKHAGVPPYAETQLYVERVGVLYQRYKASLRKNS